MKIICQVQTPDQIRKDQHQSWDSVAAGWQNWWRTFERGACSITGKLIELAEMKPGSKVLDIATGIGRQPLLQHCI